MHGTLNAHKVFSGSSSRPGYLKELNLKSDQEEHLRSARDKIRQQLRQGFPEWDGESKLKGLVERRHVALASQLPALRPKFRMQGSGVYFTINDPAHKPPQEVDYDDGVFLPTSYVSGNGLVEPLLAASAYFKIVEETLGPLCRREGWNLITTKPTCVRIRINGEAHIDLPLYAIPDKDFVELAEASNRMKLAKGVTQPDNDFELAELVYMGLREDQFMLARRDIGWQDSDPRKIEDWFKAAIADHGEVIRRVCRYIKGW
jgi:hypothetical protein